MLKEDPLEWTYSHYALIYSSVTMLFQSLHNIIRRSAVKNFLQQHRFNEVTGSCTQCMCNTCK